MTGTAYAFNWAVAGDPSYTARQLRQLQVSPFVAMGSSARPMGAKSGVRVGTPGSIASITGTGPYTFSVQPFVGVIDAEPNAAAGPYTYAFAAAESGSINPAGSVLRVDRLDVVLSDKDEGDSTGTRTVQLIYTAGAATGSQPPNPPARSHRVCYINVPTAGAPTIQWAPEWSSSLGEWTFNTAAELTAYTAAIGSTNVPTNQRAAVIEDSTTANNGDYIWSGSAWLFQGATLANIASFGPGYIGLTGAHTPRLRRVGQQVFSYGAVQTTSGFAYGNILTVPAGFLPTSTDTRFIGAGVTSSGSVFELFMAAGVVQTSASYVTSAWSATGMSIPFVTSWWLD